LGVILKRIAVLRLFSIKNGSLVLSTVKRNRMFRIFNDKKIQVTKLVGDG
jgi:hypothetical protein